MSSTDTSQRTGISRALFVLVILLLLAALAFLVWLFLELQPQDPVSIPDGEAEGYEWVRSIYGFGTSADEQLRTPSSVAVGRFGRIYATDPSRSRVLVFTPTGEFEDIVHTAGAGTGEGELLRPESIAVDDADQLYVADSKANKIIVYDAGGNFLREWPVLGQARGVDVVGDEVFVLSMGRVFVFNTEGELLYEFGRRGRAPGQIDAYQGVTADSNGIYIADSFNRRIQAFDRSGELLWARPLDGGDSKALHAAEETPSTEATVAEEAEPAEDFAWDLPQDLTFDAAGRLVVIDAFRFELVVLDPETGDVIAQHGGFGRDDGSFYYPSSVAYDPSADWFVVADTENNRVQVVRLAGSGGGVEEAATRLIASPERYIVVPLAVTLVLALLIVIMAIIYRIAARNRAARQLAAGAAGESHEIADPGAGIDLGSENGDYEDG